MTAVLDWVITSLIAIVSGTIGGVIFAPKIGMRTAQGQRRQEAVTAIYSALQKYRSTMVYRKAEIFLKQKYPADYASISSHLILARKIVDELPYIASQNRQLLRRLLVVLVGSWTVEHAERQMALPESVQNETSESAWIEQRIGDALESGDNMLLSHGKLGVVLKDLTNQSVYAEAVSTLDDMIALVRPDRHLKQWLLHGERKKLVDRLMSTEKINTNNSHLGRS